MDLLMYTPEFVEKFQNFIEQVQLKGLNIIEKDGYISPTKQARLWRQGQTDNAIDQIISFLEEKECRYMADLLRKSYALPGQFVTDNLPGCSWHNWRSAMTFYATDYINNVINDLNDPVYHDIAKIAKKCGFVSGWYFKNNQIKNLIQLSEYKSPLDQWTFKEINDNLKQMSEV